MKSHSTSLHKLSTNSCCCNYFTREFCYFREFRVIKNNKRLDNKENKENNRLFDTPTFKITPSPSGLQSTYIQPERKKLKYFSPCWKLAQSVANFKLTFNRLMFVQAYATIIVVKQKGEIKRIQIYVCVILHLRKSCFKTCIFYQISSEDTEFNPYKLDSTEKNKLLIIFLRATCKSR